jgi:hypothetical protein
MPNENSQVKSNINLPIAEALHECQRELQVRQRCYPRWVKEGKLTAFEADERANRLAAACQWLERYAEETAAQAAKVLDLADAAAA